MNFMRKKKEVGLIGKITRVRCRTAWQAHRRCNLVMFVRARMARHKSDVFLAQVGPYSVRVDALLAEGGFASVYRVQDATTQKAPLQP